MTHASIRALAATVLLGAASAAAAQGIGLVHAGTIYADAQGQKLNAPEGVACGAGPSVVIADTGNGRVLTLTMEGETVRSATELKLKEVPYPTRVVTAKDGTIFLLDRKKKRVARVVNGAFSGYVDVPGEPASAVVVGAFAVDGAGTIYLLDLAKRAVRVVDAAGGAARLIALPDEREAMIVDLAVEGSTLYAVDSLARKVWIAPGGATALRPLTKSLSDQMSFPSAIAVHKGRIYVVDQNGNGVVVLGQDGAFLGRRLSLGWTEGLVRYPGQLCFDETGRAYLADRQNNRVQAFATQ